MNIKIEIKVKMKMIINGIETRNYIKSEMKIK